uniref:Uncharacterized protein n=1 Tax=Fagus sylvatica TaxID=28930 RepID=A0A2N9FQ20_FAGSY
MIWAGASDARPKATYNLRSKPMLRSERWRADRRDGDREHLLMRIDLKRRERTSQVLVIWWLRWGLGSGGLRVFWWWPRSGSDEVESPPPSPSLPSFRFTPHPSDLVLYSGDLLEAMGDSSLHRFLSLLPARICHSSVHRDHRQQWMFGEHRIWGILSARPSIDPIFGFDYLKLF